jgi:hypothetical protein
MHVARSCHLKGHVICASEQVVLAPVLSHALNMIHCLQKLARLPADPCHRTCFQCHLRIDQVCTDLLPEAILHSCFTLVATRALEFCWIYLFYSVSFLWAGVPK